MGVFYILVFDIVVINVGNGYYSIMGVFLVFEIGVYVFSWFMWLFNGEYYRVELIYNY